MDQSVNGVPPLVRTRLALHAATTAHALETVKAELDGLGVTATRSRALRAKRERLTEELTAWEYLLHVARSASDFAVPNQVIKMPECGSKHPDGERFCFKVAGHDFRHQDGDGSWARSRETPRVEPAKCTRCHHPHLKGERCKRHVTSHGVECGCTR